MKKLKKPFAFVLSLIFTVTAFFIFVACDDATEQLNGSMTIILDAQEEGVTSKTYTVDLTKYTTADRLDDVIDNLVEEQQLYYEGYRGSMGMYYTALGYESAGSVQYILRQDVFARRYVYVYTSVEKDQDQSSYKTTVNYDGKTLVNAGMGVSFMHLESDAIVYFTYIVW